MEEETEKYKALLGSGGRKNWLVIYPICRINFYIPYVRLSSFLAENGLKYMVCIKTSRIIITVMIQ